MGSNGGNIGRGSLYSLDNRPAKHYTIEYWIGVVSGLGCNDQRQGHDFGEFRFTGDLCSWYGYTTMKVKIKPWQNIKYHKYFTFYFQFTFVEWCVLILGVILCVSWLYQ